MLKDKIKVLLGKLRENLLEREQITQLILLSALAQEHSLLIGLPGTAKSFLAKKLKDVFDLHQDKEYLERLLTRFSVPEELFGPLSIKELEKDHYIRKIDGFLPTAKIAFLDEIFKANSAILNSLLSILNERLFDQGNQRIKTPLISLIAASNELPTTEELDALFDRFLIRYHLEYVSDDNFINLLKYQYHPNPILEEEKISFKELQEIQEKSKSISLHPETRKTLKLIKASLMEKKLDISDRRWTKILHILKVAAYCQGKTEIAITDLYLLPWMIWKKQSQFQEVQSIIFQHIEESIHFNNAHYQAILVAWQNQLEINTKNKNISADKVQKDITQIQEQLGDLITDVKKNLIDIKEQISHQHLWIHKWPLKLKNVEDALAKQAIEQLKVDELIQKFKAQFQALNKNQKQLESK
jgi:MoxR-like ATPase